MPLERMGKLKDNVLLTCQTKSRAFVTREYILSTYISPFVHYLPLYHLPEEERSQAADALYFSSPQEIK